MSLYSAIGGALSGLNANQAGIDLVARNIANASTPGYTRKTLELRNNTASGDSIGVAVAAASRNVNSFLQQQMRTESATTSKLNIYADFLGRVDTMFGTPDSDSSIAGSLTALETKLQALATTPDDPAARQTFLNAASNLASQLNSMSANIQGMRIEAERNIALAVEAANNDLKTIADINDQISQRMSKSMSVADLEDLRDNALNDLARLMDIKVVARDDGKVAVFTGAGQLLLDQDPVKLTFDERTNLGATSFYDIDKTERQVGTVTLQNGTTAVDLIASGAFRSGAIAGYIDMRDKLLPQAQAQLDELAAQMALALSQETLDGTATTSGAATGFDVDTSSLLSGNTIHLTYTDTPAGTVHNVTIVKVMDPTVLPLSNDATADPSDEVIGIDFNQPMAGIVADLQAALPASVVVSNPAGAVLSFLDDGLAGASDVNALSATFTPTALADAGTGLPLFVDGRAQTPYSGSLGNPPQIVGFAGRIAVNAAVLADDTSLVVYQTSPQTAIGDDTRPNALLARLTDSSRLYGAGTGIGSAATPFAGSVDSFARRIVSFQSSQAASAVSEAQAQEVVSNSLQDRFDSETGVNIDDEMAKLIVLQNAYAANARLISTIQDLFQILLSIGR